MEFSGIGCTRVFYSGAQASFGQVYKDFTENAPRGKCEIALEPLFSMKWLNGVMSSNDLLILWLDRQGIEYIVDFDGVVWFIYNGAWTRSKLRTDRETNTAHFSVCIFE